MRRKEATREMMKREGLDADEWRAALDIKRGLGASSPRAFSQRRDDVSTQRDAMRISQSKVATRRAARSEDVRRVVTYHVLAQLV